MARVAFIGLGNMGGGMAANLAKAGHEVMAFDLSPDALARAKTHGCSIADSAETAVANVEAVVTMLPAGKHVAEVYRTNVLLNAPKTAILMDCSTIDVATAKAVGGEAAFVGFEMVDAPVSGFALGGGCEVAMMADFIIAADSAKFGQPEIKLGVTPGMGGSQRLTHAVGKAKAMEMCLTGRMMGAEEAERSGLVAMVVPAADLIDEALKTAETIAAMAPLAAIATKEMVNAAYEMSLSQGINFERRLFHGLFGTEDQNEGMSAFVDKRPGNWTGK